jgi:serine/threonine protein kinase
MLELNPKDRYTPEQCIKHPFFKTFESYAKDMRKKYPPVTSITNNVTIIDCIERRWAVNILYNIYNKRKKYKWYSHDLMFQALRIFDEYLDYAFSREDVKLKDEVNETQGKLNTKKEVEIYTYTCVYIMYKHYSTLYKFYPWTSIFPTDMINDETLSTMEEFEKYLIRKICKYVIFKPTFLDILSKETEEKSTQQLQLDIKNYFVNYGRVKTYEGSLMDLYNQIKTHLNSS